jgi:hypothetical protein
VAGAESVGDVLAEAESVGDALGVALPVPTICSAVRTTDDAGGDAQFAVAALAALTAKPVTIIPAPKNAIPIIRPCAAGFRSNALTDANLASVSRPATTLVVDLRHSTHALAGEATCRELHTKGS